MQRVLLVTSEGAHRVLYGKWLREHFEVELATSTAGGYGDVDAVVYDVPKYPRWEECAWVEDLGVPVVVLTREPGLARPRGEKCSVLTYPVRMEKLLEALVKLGLCSGAERRAPASSGRAAGAACEGDPGPPSEVDHPDQRRHASGDAAAAQGRALRCPGRILLAADRDLVRLVFANYLRKGADLKLVSEVRTSEDAVAETARLKPDVTLLEVDLPGEGSFVAARKIREQDSGSRVVFLSAYFQDRVIEQVLSNVMAKLSIRDRVLLARFAIREGLLKP
ncbi:MAG: response regulator [Planctomycetes bacterium]|nr:response regulator [Planctomycetota bacterium]